ncbi:hypothetical protein HOM50_03150 [bacterium]|jgi:hypothetical protein|nr:hypothetical protein [bacterium]MBT5015373.1 hypothetical protein [bacterium]
MQKKYYFYDMKTNNTNFSSSMNALVKSIRILLINDDLENFYTKVFALPLYSGKLVKATVCNVEYRVWSFGCMHIKGGPYCLVEYYKKLFELLLKASNIDDLLIVFDGLEFDVISEEKEKKIIIESNKGLEIRTAAEPSPRTNEKWDIPMGHHNSDAISLIGMAFSNPLFFHDTYENFIGGHAYDCSGVYVSGEGGKEVSLIDEEGQGDTKAVYPLEPFWKLRLEYQERVYDVKKDCRLIQIAWDGKEFGLYVEFEEEH